MGPPDGYAVTITQANVLVSLSPGRSRHVPGTVLLQCPRTNDPSAGVHLVNIKDSAFPGIEMGQLDSHDLVHKYGVNLEEWWIWGTHVGDQMIIMHGGEG